MSNVKVRNDVSVELLRHTPGHLGKVRHRAQIGQSNRRENYSEVIAPALASLRVGSPSVFRDALDASVSRGLGASSPALSLHSGGGRRSASPAAAAAAAAGPARSMLDSLASRGAGAGSHPFTAERLFFNSEHVGSGDGWQFDSCARRHHAHLRAPPAVPTSTQIFQTLAARKAAAATVHRADLPAAPTPGLAAVVKPADGVDEAEARAARTEQCVLPVFGPRSFPSTPVARGSGAAAAARASATPDRASEAARQRHYFASVSGLSAEAVASVPSAMPAVELPRPKLRQELTDYHPTHDRTQPPPGCGMAATETQRFAVHDRGLGNALSVQVERFAAGALRELRAARRGAAAARVLDACEHRDRVPVERAEGCIERRRAEALASWNAEQERKRKQWAEDQALQNRPSPTTMRTGHR